MRLFLILTKFNFNLKKINFNFNNFNNLVKHTTSFTFYSDIYVSLLLFHNLRKNIIVSLAFNSTTNIFIFADKYTILFYKKIYLIYNKFFSTKQFNFYNIITKFLGVQQQKTLRNILYNNKKISINVPFYMINTKIEKFLTTAEIEQHPSITENVDFYLKFLLHRLNKTIYVDFYI